jgi:hypothetical protein
MKAKQIGKLIASLFLPLAIGGIAGMVTADAIPGWYASLNQPSFNPPNQINADRSCGRCQVWEEERPDSVGRQGDCRLSIFDGRFSIECIHRPW